MTLIKSVRLFNSSETLVEKQQTGFSKHVGRVGLTSFDSFLSNKAGYYGRDVAGIAKYQTLEEPERSVTRCGTYRYPLSSAETDIGAWDILYRTIFPDGQLIPSRCEYGVIELSCPC